MASLPEIDNWLNEVLNSPEPPDSIIAYYFGLFEAPKFYVLYLIGSPEFDDEDDDWTFEIGYEPTKKYHHLEGPEWKGLKWEAVLDKVKTHLKSSPMLASGRFADAEAIAVGFDDGDLVRIK